MWWYFLPRISASFSYKKEKKDSWSDLYPKCTSYVSECQIDQYL